MNNPFDELKQELRELKMLVLNSNVSVSPEPIYLKKEKAAEFLSTTANALNVMVHKGQIPYIKKQNKLYFLQSELVEWLESGRIEPVECHPEDILLPNKKGVKPHG